MAEQRLYIGTGAAETGIYTCRFNPETGEVSESELVADAPKPGFLALHPNKDILYAVTAETAEPGGAVRAYQFNRKSGQLSLLNLQSTRDVGATHLEVDRSGELIVVAHYQGGSTASLPINDDGTIGDVACSVKHQGSSVHPERQFEPFAHGVAFSHDSQFVCIADLGTDEIVVYQIDPQHQLAEASCWNAKPGAGPRHLMFHPNRKWLYCINELDNTVDALAFDSERGTLVHLQNISTLPDGYSKENATAELVVHPNGRYLYGSNRGDNSTVIYSIDQESGLLSQIGFEPTGGDHPRFIGMDPSGKTFIAANRNSDNLVSFLVNAENGLLLSTGFKTSVPKPTCVVFVN